MVDIYDGTHQTPKYTAFGIKFVSVENISNLESKKFIGQEAYTKEYAKKPAEKGDVLMTRIGDIGTSHVVETDEPLAYYVTLALLKPKKIDSNFLSWLISSPKVQQNIWKRTLHIAFPKKINLGEINQVEASIPKESEQQQIGAFFKQLDNTIVQNERKIDLLKQLKQAYLQKIFSQELRFTGFSDAWEERKIMDLFEERVERSSHGQMISVTIGSGVVLASSLDRKDNSSSDKSNYKVVRKNDIAYNSMRMWQGASGVSPYNGILSPAYTIITPKTSVNSGFFAIQFKMTKSLKTFQKYSQGLTSDTWNLKYPALGIIPMLAPNITEQKRIYHFFGNLDNLIGKYERKISLLKRKKRAYLQKMFI